ncbi:MAG TPA: hypothetical protein VEH86_00150 [Candidatus Acidoferrum sp.]|nr:hypothetical protein [Candidatus Acidoferrum sp.]
MKSASSDMAVVLLSYGDWLQQKAAESAHNEILAFLIVILGINISIGGLIVTIMILGGPNFLLFLTQQPLTVSIALGPILALLGFLMAATGFILTFYHDRKRSWYLKEMQKSSIFEQKKDQPKTADDVLEGYARGKNS